MQKNFIRIWLISLSTIVGGWSAQAAGPLAVTPNQYCATITGFEVLNAEVTPVASAASSTTVNVPVTVLNEDLVNLKYCKGGGFGALAQRVKPGAFSFNGKSFPANSAYICYCAGKPSDGAGNPRGVLSALTLVFVILAGAISGPAPSFSRRGSYLQG